MYRRHVVGIAAFVATTLAVSIGAVGTGCYSCSESTPSPLTLPHTKSTIHLPILMVGLIKPIVGVVVPQTIINSGVGTSG